MSKHQAPVEFRTFEEARAHVHALVADKCADDSCLVWPVLEQCVDDAVSSRWTEGTVSNFVPILAFREVEQCIRQGYCPDRATETA